MVSVQVYVSLFLFSLIGTLTIAWIPNMINGRPADGTLGAPPVPDDVTLPEPQFYEFQLVNHFDGSDLRYWKQRYYLNEDFHKPGGPIFLMFGGTEEVNPKWMVEGTWIQYAKMYSALCVMLEHRYYGKSHPVQNLTTSNLQYLSSRQALADAANFIADLRKWVKYQIQNSTLIVFGGGYAGSLAAWFRSKYPYMVDGAVASSAPIVAEMDFQEYYVQVGAALDTTGPTCRAEVDNATKTMYSWWGQPEKREEMQTMFKLCDKINHEDLIEVTVFFYNLAVNFANVVQYNKVNRAFEGAVGLNITVDTLCDIMTNESRGSNIQRYADVNSLILETYSQTCLNIRYQKLLATLNQTSWDSFSAKGSRQWLYQQCSELGWFQSSWSKQPFGYWFTFPWNYTTDQCIDIFKRPFGGEQCAMNVDETNRYYGVTPLTSVVISSRDHSEAHSVKQMYRKRIDTTEIFSGRKLPISNVVFVNGALDPWKPASVTQDLSPDATAIYIEGTSHCADMYPPTAEDPPQLTQAREHIGMLIGKWIQHLHN